MAEEHIHIRLSEERKERWKKEVDERPEWRSITHLIITAVEEELRDEPDGSVASIDIEPVNERLDEIRDEMREMHDTIDETYIHVRDDSHSSGDLMSRIQDIIPSGDREEILETEPTTPAVETPEEELEGVVNRTGSTSHLTRLLQSEGYDPIEIKGAVEQLADDVTTIEATYAEPKRQEDKRIYRVQD